MKLSEKIKNKKKFIIGVVIGIVVVNIIGIAGAIAASVSSDVVLYNSPTGKKNVKDSIDELYTMASTHCPDGKSCYTKPTWVDNDGNGNVSEGDLITYGTENFYVISNDGNLIKMLPQYNITLDTTNPVQSSTTDKIAFFYKYDSSVSNYVAYWDNFPGDDYPKPVYCQASALYDYVEAYKNKLINLGAKVEDATLLDYETAYYLVTTKKYTWAQNQGYWLGDARSSFSVYIVVGVGEFTYNGVVCSIQPNVLSSMSPNSNGTSYGGGCNGGGGSYSSLLGIRPVITIHSF